MAKIGSSSPQRERRLQESIKNKQEVGLRRKTRLEIKRAMDDMAKAFESSGDIGVETSSAQHEDKMRSAMGPAQRKAFETAGKRLQSQIEEVTKDFDDVFQQEVQAYLETDGAQNIQKVTQTTKQNVRAIIARGQADQLNATDIRKQIEGLSTRFSLARSAMIARTEVGIAYSKGNFAAAGSSGVQLKKEWVSGSTDNPRDFHESLDGVKVEMDEFFNDGFSDLMYPRDPSGAPESIINCTCAVVYETQD